MPVSSELNPPQRAAVESIGGPLLVIAGPGAGRTKALVERIALLIIGINAADMYIGPLRSIILGIIEEYQQRTRLVRTIRFWTRSSRIVRFADS